MALCRGGSKDPNKNDKKDKNNNFNKKIQKLLSAMAWGTRGSKDPNEDDENNDFGETCKNHWVKWEEGW